ncbi:MAG: DNA internalization-related competence protein ComEC/Rec2 [Cellulosilyticaceae bacterium]
MKNSLLQKNRPFIEVSIYMILGIMGGNIWIRDLYVSFFLFLVVFLIGNLVLNKWYTTRWIIILVSISFLFMLRVQNHPLEREKNILLADENIKVIGNIKEIKTGEYATQIVLENVWVEKEEITPLSSKLIVLVDETVEKYELYDQIICEGKVVKEPVQMNPSDMDYASYLRGKGIVGRIKVTSIRVIEKQTHLVAKWRKGLKERVELIFREKDKGIVAATLLGEKEGIDEEISQLYFDLGIGHLLAISGLHISIILFMSLWVCRKIGIGYTERQWVGIMSIWGYAILTGVAVSTVRAAIMLSVMLVGRCVWEEEDFPTSIAIAAVVVLGINPFQLTQVGFQLSFGAVIGIGFYQYIMDCSIAVNSFTRKQKRIIELILVPTVIFLFIAPILSYHFFEVSLLGNLFNLIVMPLFGVLIPSMIFVVGISVVNLDCAQWMAEGIVRCLNSVEDIGKVIMECPIATWCVGRPSLESLIVYYIVLIGMIWSITHKIKIIPIGIGVIGTCLLVMQSIGIVQRNTEITQLYVGQGDSTVIITPNKKALLVDGGPTGKGETIERYLKYRGITKLEAIILSHPHEDHIGGILELLESGIEISNLFVPVGSRGGTELEELTRRSEGLDIPIYEIGKRGKIIIEEMVFQAIWPYGEVSEGDLNEQSLVMLMEVGEFRGLFTGDIGKQTEDMIKHELEDINWLKVAHHGSKNSTQETFLLQTRPEYAIISCGVNNIYGHPHMQTLETLEQYPIEVLRTDLHGAISIYTDGVNELKLSYQVQEDKKIYDGD